MFEIQGWLIAVIAVGAALLLVGLPLTIHAIITRRRHQQYMQQSEQDLRVYLRPRLSARASNYADIVRPPSYVRRNNDAKQPEATSTPLQTQELIMPDPGPPAQPEDSPMPTKAKRKKGLRDSIYGHSGLHAPKTRRQKKIDKAISMKDLNRSPLSAITEMTDSTVNDLPMPVELPTDRTPDLSAEPASAISPLQANVTWSIPAQKPRPEHLSPLELDTPVSLKRELSVKQAVEMPISPSKSSVSEVPDSPLPPLPTYQLYHKPSGAKRTSQLSTVTVSSSVLGGFSSSELNLPQTVNSGMQEFDFGFNKAPPPRVGPSPGRQTDWHGGRGVTSVIADLDFYGRQTSTASTIEEESERRNSHQANTVEWTPGPDFFFGKQLPESARTSVDAPTGHDYLARQHRQMIGDVSPTLLPPRPASVATSQPFRLSQAPHVSRSRLSVSSTGSGRRAHGHRRQNCMRIQIPAIPISPAKRPSAISMIRRPSHISEAPEDSDEDSQPSPSKVKVVDVSLNNSPQSRKRLSARRSIVDANGSPSIPPVMNRNAQIHVADRPLTARSASSSDSGSPRPDSDVFWSLPNDFIDGAKKGDPFAYPDRWALMPTRPGSIGLEPGSKLSVFEHPNSEEDSPILPSPCKPATANSSATRPRDSRPLGPRQAPAFPSTNVNLHRSLSKLSTQPRTGPGSPTRRTSFKEDSTEATTQDIRQSVTQLRSLDSSGRHLNTKSKLWTEGDTPVVNQNHEDWKQLNALWEVSRSNSINSQSTRTTPGLPTRHPSNVASSMARKSSIQYSNTTGSMFGSTKRKMFHPPGTRDSKTSRSGIAPTMSLTASNSTRFRSRSASGSPSRFSLNSYSNVSIWEDDSIRGDSPEPGSAPHSRRPSLSARGQQPAAGPPPPPPPRLESLQHGPFVHQYHQYPWKSQTQQGRNRPQGLGITIPAPTYHHHRQQQPLHTDPSPTQKQLKARYFGSVDWDKDTTSTLAKNTSNLISPTNVNSDAVHIHEKENIITLSPSSATPTSGISTSFPFPIMGGHQHPGPIAHNHSPHPTPFPSTSTPSNTTTTRRKPHRERDSNTTTTTASTSTSHDPDALDIYSTPPTSTSTSATYTSPPPAHPASDLPIAANSIPYSHHRYAFNFPLPGSGSRSRPGTSSGAANGLAHAPGSNNSSRPGTAGSVAPLTSPIAGSGGGGVGGGGEASGSGGSAGLAKQQQQQQQQQRKVSPAQQRLKEQLRERAASMSMNMNMGASGAGARSPSPKVLGDVGVGKGRRGGVSGLGMVGQGQGQGQLGSAFVTPQGSRSTGGARMMQGEGGAEEEERASSEKRRTPREGDGSGRAGMASPRGQVQQQQRQYHQQQQGYPSHPPRGESLRTVGPQGSGASSAASRSRSGTPSSELASSGGRRMEQQHGAAGGGSKTPTPASTPTAMATPSHAAAATGGGGGIGGNGSGSASRKGSGVGSGSAGGASSAKTMRSLYDSDGILRESPLARKGPRAMALGDDEDDEVVIGGGNGHSVGQLQQGAPVPVVTGAAGGLVGRSYRRGM